MTAAITTLLLFQMQMPIPQTNSSEERRVLLELYTRQVQEQKLRGKSFQQEQAARDAVLQNYFFSVKFNKFVSSLRNFIAHYNEGKVNMKEVKAVQKAWRDLERTEGWFQREQAKIASENEGQKPKSIAMSDASEQASCTAAQAPLAAVGGQ